MLVPGWLLPLFGGLRCFKLVFGIFFEAIIHRFLRIGIPIITELNRLVQILGLRTKLTYLTFLNFRICYMF